MKNLFKTALIILVSLSSCQEDALTPSPDEQKEAQSKNFREGTFPPTIKSYQLVKHGDNKLSYTQDGKLEKVIYGLTKRGAYSSYITYKYGSQTISSTLYNDGKIIQLSTYSLDAKGRCAESRQVDRIYNGLNTYVEKESNFTYQYNAKGQLVTRINKKVLTEKTIFTWDANDDLKTTTGHDFLNGHAYESVPAVCQFYYAYLELFDNLRPINEEAANLPDPYLMIFGKPSKHLARMIYDHVPLSSKILEYIFNSDGYVVSRNIQGDSGATWIETKSYEYVVSDVVLNL